EEEMNLYDDCAGKLAPFTAEKQTVTVYVCGITPYDTTHLGHAFTYASFDVLIRYLEYRGYTVRYCQNVTDIDDDILRKAREVGSDWHALGNAWTAHFIRDMIALNVRPPDFYPRATEVIDNIITVVARLIEAGVAYPGNGNVYFDVERFPEYGQLSGIPKDEMLPIANERGNRPDDPHKRHPLDFVLWQAQAPGEPAWGSPWGPGRPGWHIECSTMAGTFLGPNLDIHGGGGDLIFPHHESEIAQAVCSTGHEPFARYWLHTAMVHHDGEKMSKSLGNLVMISDLLQRTTADALRLYLAGHHYRDVWTHSEAALAEAGRGASLLAAAAGTTATAGRGAGAAPLDPGPAEAALVAALDDDLDTPTALAALLDLGRHILTAAAAGVDVAAAQTVLRRAAAIFGLRLDAGEPEPRVQDGWGEHLTRFE
ncbi:MAG TPA: cysteine--tRNA ligase, partial [Anaerolineae bacterium]